MSFAFNFMKKTLALAFAITAIAACSDSEQTSTPKPRGYPRIILPQKNYQNVGENYCNFSFQYPTYANIEHDTLFFDQAAPSDCWFNLKVPSLNAVVHFSYYAISGKNTHEKLRNDAFNLAGKHNIKADYIDELPIRKPNNVSGFVFNIEGPAACPFQFYLTDSTRNFVRGALYFNSEMRPDSLAPVIDFLKTDIMQMINTFEWKK